MEITTNTKVCKKCGRELPVYEFYKADTNKDGLLGHCKECHKSQMKDRGKAARKTLAENETPLSTFTPRELIEELRKRGYKGTLYVTREVVL
jgi:hypothetical protein